MAPIFLPDRLRQFPLSNVRGSPEEPWPPPWTGKPSETRRRWKRVKPVPDNLAKLPPKKPKYLPKQGSPAKRIPQPTTPKKPSPRKGPKKAKGHAETTLVDQKAEARQPSAEECPDRSMS